MICLPIALTPDESRRHDFRRRSMPSRRGSTSLALAFALLACGRSASSPHETRDRMFTPIAISPGEYRDVTVERLGPAPQEVREQHDFEEARIRQPGGR